MGIWLITGIFVIGGITGIAVGIAHILNKRQESKERKNKKK